VTNWRQNIELAHELENARGEEPPQNAWCAGDDGFSNCRARPKIDQGVSFASKC